MKFRKRQSCERKTRDQSRDYVECFVEAEETKEDNESACVEGFVYFMPLVSGKQSGRLSRDASTYLSSLELERGS